MVARHGRQGIGRGGPVAGGCGARRAGGRRSSAWGEGANGWRRGAWMGVGRIEVTGRIANESYRRDDGAARMHVGRISERGAGCAGACGKWPSDGILSRRMSRRQHVPFRLERYFCISITQPHWSMYIHPDLLLPIHGLQCY